MKFQRKNIKMWKIFLDYFTSLNSSLSSINYINLKK